MPPVPDKGGRSAAGSQGQGRGVKVYWRPHQEVYPELPKEPDFLAFDEATDQSIGRVRWQRARARADPSIFEGTDCPHSCPVKGEGASPIDGNHDDRAAER